MIIKRCDYCGKEFEAEYDGKFMFCSDECKKEGKRIFSTITKKCRVCGREFETDRKNTSCCSDECKKEANRIHSRERYKPAKPVTKVCEICGKEFEAHGNAKYCCDECRKEGCKRSQQKYQQSDKGKKARKKYLQSDEGKKAVKKYWQSDKGKKAQKKATKKYIQDKIDELKKKYDGDLDLILKDCPNMWMLREAIMQVEYGKSYVEAMYQKAKFNPVCEITGKSGDLVIHHLDSFNLHPEKGADLDNLVRIKKEIHDEFHNIYGRGNNTREQWFEFTETEAKGLEWRKL